MSRRINRRVQRRAEICTGVLILILLVAYICLKISGIEMPEPLPAK